MAKTTRYWLMKSEPDVYSIDDLKKDRSTSWEGVRNYQARNFMRDEMKTGDLVLFYHSNANPPGVAGVAKICKEAYPDDAAWNKRSKYYDEKSSKDNPRWFMVDVQFVEKFNRMVELQVLRDTPALKNLLVIKRGQRLSIQPVDQKDFEKIRKMGQGN